MLAARSEQAVYVADNESKDFIAPNRLGPLTVRLRRPRGLYRQPSAQPDAAPRVEIDRMGDLALVLGLAGYPAGYDGRGHTKMKRSGGRQVRVARLLTLWPSYFLRLPALCFLLIGTPLPRRRTPAGTRLLSPSFSLTTVAANVIIWLTR
jgi:hypothetical protein